MSTSQKNPPKNPYSAWIINQSLFQWQADIDSRPALLCTLFLQNLWVQLHRGQVRNEHHGISFYANVCGCTDFRRQNTPRL